jgi:hypothetical protein
LSIFEITAIGQIRNEGQEDAFHHLEVEKVFQNFRGKSFRQEEKY